MKIKKEIKDKTLDLMIYAIYLVGFEDGATQKLTGELLMERMDNFRVLLRRESK
jgi:hypothetical protein